jgi:Glycosyl hydrolases family 43
MEVPALITARAARGRLSHPGGRRRSLALGFLTVAVLVGFSAAWAHFGSGPPQAGPSSGSPTAHPVAPGLPRLGNAEAVEVDNPALNDIGDPFVLPVSAGPAGLAEPGYAVFWTTDWTANVPVAVSTDLIHWRRTPDALPALPSWARVVRPPPSWPVPAAVSTMTWGPVVHQIGARWVLYFSTQDATSGRECIGAAVSASPIGPFSDGSATPLVCQSALGGDIDPSVVVPAPGHLALVWKNDGNSVGRPVALWEQALTPDGRSVTGIPNRLVGADQTWEHGILEGPAMLADTKGGWWLFFSGGTWQSDTYDTGVVWCASVAGPCREPVRVPFLASTPTAVSPGGLDTLVDHQGHLWASYSAFPAAPADARAAMASPRVLELARVLAH